MKIKTLISAIAGLLTISAWPLQAQVNSVPPHYRNVIEVREFMNLLQKANPSVVTIHKIATSPGGLDITLMEIGNGSKKSPAILVGANFEGKTPLATEGALKLAKMLLDSSKYTRNLTWFILPLANPDAASGYFSAVKWERTVNGKEVNDDVDDQTNEDGPDDLNKDGIITQMRVEDPEGTYIISLKDPRIMVRADASKGERGKFKLYPEGIDNDGDGKYNEDGPGGVDVGINFPHLFKSSDKESGLWPGEAPEAYGIMSFVFDHPEIAMVFTLGSSDFCIAPPRTGRRGGANLESIKVPARYASRFGIDPEKTFTMAEIMELFKASMPAGAGREITPDMIASQLGLGAAVNPIEEDLKFYTELSDKYKEFLKKQGYSTDRLAAEADKDGSFELWAYYHLGVPSFSMNLFAPPKPKEEKPATGGLTTDEVEKMSSEDFIALGEEKIAGFLKAQNAPERMSASRIIEMLKSGRFSPKQLVTMMKAAPQTQAAKTGELDEKDKVLLSYVDKNPDFKGFVKWEPYMHPKLGKVEIGGYAPFITTTPPATQIDSLCRVQLPWLLQLSTKLPALQFLKENVTDLGAGIYKLELFVENSGYLPYPISMGARNRQPAPVVILLEGEKIEILEGFQRTPLETIGGNQVKKFTWIIKSTGKTEIKATLDSAVFGTSSKQIKIGG
jgi:hypothetical protein